MIDSNPFYDSVAKEYDDQMRSDSRNERIRMKVATYFQAVAKGKYVMDFGGGTGADSEWLLKNKYEVCFCEPSARMRNEAMHLYQNKIHSGQLTFLDDAQTDFTLWNPDTFSRKFDAALANFCVFNCIEDMGALFVKLSSILHNGGHIVALMLDTTNNGIVKYHLKDFIRSRIKNKVPTLTIQHSGIKHTVYLHTPPQLKRTLPPDLSTIKIMPLGKPGFMLVHLKKKG